MPSSKSASPHRGDSASASFAGVRVNLSIEPDQHLNLPDQPSHIPPLADEWPPQNLKLRPRTQQELASWRAHRLHRPTPLVASRQVDLLPIVSSLFFQLRARMIANEVVITGIGVILPN